MEVPFESGDASGPLGQPQHCLAIAQDSGSRTRLVLSGSRTGYTFDADAFFQGSSLQQTLNRTSDAVSLGYRQSLTVVTTFVMEGEARRDRFQFAPARDADSVRVQAGFDLDDRALISGRVRIGYRKFDGLEGLPQYKGLVASAASAVTLRGRTRVGVAVDRDVNYSYQPSLPYYVLTGAILTVTPRLTQRWDVQGRFGGQRLAYKAIAGAEGDERVDAHVTIGGGLGYYFGDDFRIGLNFDRERRSSPRQARDYSNNRIGASVTYGL